MSSIRLGAGAGYSGDRIEPAVDLAASGDLDYLVFECLAERTIALAQGARQADPNAGYDPLLDERMRAILPLASRNGTQIISNMGAANPLAAARRIGGIARELGLSLKVAAVTGDDVLDVVTSGNWPIEETGGHISDLGDRILSANAYLGAAPIVEGLAAGADVVVTGRVADPALFLAPMIHEFGWAMDAWDRLGQGTLVGHLMECAGQVTGGYFADPGRKDVAGLARLGFPIAEIRADGEAVITKLSGTGGAVTAATCKEQLLYEIHDPAAYFQPDLVADFSDASVEEIAPDRVRIAGGRGRPHNGSLKVSVGYLDGWIGEGEISYAGPGAVARGRLALEIVRERLAITGVALSEIRADLIGLNSLYPGTSHDEPPEVRIRVAGRTQSQAEALRIGNEVETLYTNGPAGGGGASKSIRRAIGVVSILIPRERAQPRVQMLEVTR
jgi:acyclic terpene utilization AtuA family protein